MSHLHVVALFFLNSIRASAVGESLLLQNLERVIDPPTIHSRCHLDLIAEARQTVPFRNRLYR